MALGAALATGVVDGILAKDADWSSYRGVVPLVVALIGTLSYRSSAFQRWERV